jgi:hypothetical protein
MAAWPAEASWATARISANPQSPIPLPPIPHQGGGVPGGMHRRPKVAAGSYAGTSSRPRPFHHRPGRRISHGAVRAVFSVPIPNPQSPIPLPPITEQDRDVLPGAPRSRFGLRPGLYASSPGRFASSGVRCQVSEEPTSMVNCPLSVGVHTGGLAGGGPVDELVVRCSLSVATDH